MYRLNTIGGDVIHFMRNTLLCRAGGGTVIVYIPIEFQIKGSNLDDSGGQITLCEPTDEAL